MKFTKYHCHQASSKSSPQGQVMLKYKSPKNANGCIEPVTFITFINRDFFKVYQKDHNHTVLKCFNLSPGAEMNFHHRLGITSIETSYRSCHLKKLCLHHQFNIALVIVITHHHRTSCIHVDNRDQKSPAGLATS